MGCTQSKIENEEAVTRCKERKQFMKEAVAARNAFAAAHSAYAMSLKNTGAALSDYAHGEVLNTQSVTSASHQSSASAAAVQPPLDPLPPPPPPPSLTSLDPLPHAPIQRAVSMPEMKLPKSREQGNVVGPTIVEESDGDYDEEEESNEKLVTRKRSSGRNKSGDHQKAAPAVAQEMTPPPAIENSGSVQTVQDWDYWFSADTIPGPSLEVKEEKDNVENKVFDEIPKREEYEEENPKVVPPPPPMEVEKDVGEDEKVAVASASGGGSVGRSVKRGKSAMGVGEKRAATESMNLLQVFVELDDNFLRASESAHEVSKMLEATRLHYHSNFADNRGNCLV